MPASGKSTVGVLAAKALGLGFVDTDLLLQRHVRRTLQEFLERDGSAAFLATENRLLTELEAQQTVVSTGGSAVYHAEGMERLKANGFVVWLDVGFSELERRLGDISTRGVVLAPGQSLRDLYHERQPLYQRWADARLVVEREALEATVTRLVACLPPSLTSR